MTEDVYKMLLDWELTKWKMCFDTTALNTDAKQGESTTIKKK